MGKEEGWERALQLGIVFYFLTPFVCAFEKSPTVHYMCIASGMLDCEIAANRREFWLWLQRVKQIKQSESSSDESDNTPKNSIS